MGNSYIEQWETFGIIYAIWVAEPQRGERSLRKGAYAESGKRGVEGQSHGALPARLVPIPRIWSGPES